MRSRCASLGRWGRISGWAALAGAGLLFGGQAYAQQAEPAVTIEAASILTTEQAAALVAVNVIGEPLPVALALELAKFTRDLEANENVQQVQAIKAELSAKTTTAIATLGLNQLPALNGTALGMPFQPGTTLQTIFNTLGTANTVAWLAGSLIVPDLAPFLLPHNIRSVATHTQTRTTTTTTGQTFVPVVTPNVAVGQSFTTTVRLDADVLTVAAIDQALISDTIVAQVPISTFVALTVTCTRISAPILGRRCLQISSATTSGVNDAVLATAPSYRFAYPVNAGQFATRSTASDALLIGYDLIGSLHSQVPASGLFASPFARAPGFEVLVPGTSLPELGTQSPPVTFYGMQTTSDAVLLNTLTNGVLASTLRLAGLAPVDLRNHPPVPAQGILGTGLSLPRHRLGVTAGYRATELRAQRPNFMFVRWHNLGSSTVTDALGNVLGALNPSLVLPESLALPFASAPATFYYDVPAGQYTLSADRVDTQGGVFVVDYGVAAAAPPVVFPPTLTLGGLLGGLGGLLQPRP
ncbi:hypothetical protein [Nevskia ramosa]|uniref:hypothetical protein n=1 Tax=Nevskia ramosa TaxID=64002 RepID=UPI0023555AF3|nr:hypothetical protein [Nevskia ramosa]